MSKLQEIAVIVAGKLNETDTAIATAYSNQSAQFETDKGEVEAKVKREYADLIVEEGEMAGQMLAEIAASSSQKQAEVSAIITDGSDLDESTVMGLVKIANDADLDLNSDLDAQYHAVTASIEAEAEALGTFADFSASLFV